MFDLAIYRSTNSSTTYIEPSEHSCQIEALFQFRRLWDLACEFRVMDLNIRRVQHIQFILFRRFLRHQAHTFCKEVTKKRKIKFSTTHNIFFTSLTPPTAFTVLSSVFRNVKPGSSDTCRIWCACWLSATIKGRSKHRKVVAEQRNTTKKRPKCAPPPLPRCVVVEMTAPRVGPVVVVVPVCAW